MGGKPLVAHCPSKSCRDWLRAFQWGRASFRPRIPVPVQPLSQRLARRSGRTVLLTWLECPECNHLFESTAYVSTRSA
jgi:hypothetical protein